MIPLLISTLLLATSPAEAKPESDPESDRTMQLVVGAVTAAAGALGVVSSAAVTAATTLVMAAIVFQHAKDSVLPVDTDVAFKDNPRRFLWTNTFRATPYVILGAVGVVSMSVILVSVGLSLVLGGLLPRE